MNDVKRGNFAYRDPAAEIDDGATIHTGNFGQVLPDTLIMVGKPLVILGGNWTNVRKDPAWDVQGGLWVQMDFCSHLRPDLIDYGLSEEVEDCAHVVSTDEVIIDGQSFIVRHRKHTVL